MQELSQEQFEVLEKISNLNKAKVKATQELIAKQIKKTRGNISQFCIKLIDKGLIKSTHSDGYFIVGHPSVKVLEVTKRTVKF